MQEVLNEDEVLLRHELRHRNILDIFSGRVAEGFKTENGIGYKPLNLSLNPSLLHEHLKGTRTLACFQLDEKSKVKWIAWDIDGKDPASTHNAVKRLGHKLTSFDITYGTEYSGRKGYHIITALEEPLDAVDAKKIADAILKKCGLDKPSDLYKIESYPKQINLNTGSSMGSHLRIPFGKHPITGTSGFLVDIDNFEPISWENEKKILTTRVPILKLMSITLELFAEPIIAEILVPHWRSGQRHELALGLAGLLAQSGWGIEKSSGVVEKICKLAKDEEIENRLGCVSDTYFRIENGEIISGWATLDKILSQDDLKALKKCVITHADVGTELGQIDNIRLGKGPTWLKIRSAKLQIWDVLNNTGKLIVDNRDNTMYCYNENRKTTHSMATADFRAMMHIRFGLTAGETFSDQIMTGLSNLMLERSERVPVYRLSHWDGDKLRVCLGGKEVYELDGNDITVSDNGSSNVLFRSKTTMPAIIPVEQPGINIWDTLVNNISWSQSSNSPYEPTEQREMFKAWILGIFFGDVMPTRPILVVLGAPGSGKTTSLRRVLKIVEGLDSEVTELVSEKQDAFRATIANHYAIVMDNLEKSKATWLVDTLNRIATGSQIELRQLYKTNDLYVIRPDLWVSITAVDLPFSDETLFSRMLPLELTKINSPISENTLQKYLRDNWLSLWANLLHNLNNLTLVMKTCHEEPFGNSRLADWVTWASIASNSSIFDKEVLRKGLNKLNGVQEQELQKTTSTLIVLDMYLKDATLYAGSQKMTVSDLFQVLSPLARAYKMEWRWTTPTSFGRHLDALEPTLIDQYKCKIEEYVEEKTRRIEKTYQFFE